MSRVGFSSFLLAKKKISFSILLRYILTIYYFLLGGGGGVGRGRKGSHGMSFTKRGPVMVGAQLLCRGEVTFILQSFHSEGCSNTSSSPSCFMLQTRVRLHYETGP